MGFLHFESTPLTRLGYRMLSIQVEGFLLKYSMVFSAKG